MAQIETGYQILSEIEATCPKPVAKNGKRTANKKSVAKGNVMHNTNKYYSLIPHAFGFQVPPKIDTLQKVHDERELLDALRGTIEAAQSLKNLKKSRSQKDIYHRLYDKLPCEIQAVSEEISAKIEECLKLRAPTHLYKLALKNAFEIVDSKIKEEAEPVRKRGKSTKKAEAKRLLWHGTRVTNVFSILMNGLVIPKGIRDDLMFGNGVYFANVPSKSANYCIPKDGGRVFMLLCEVDIGNPLVLYESETMAMENMRKAKKEIVYAAGKQTPKEEIEINGVPIFKGGLSDIEEESELLYDEYVVYDSEKFRIKYVVELETNKLTPQEMMNLMI
ncbi:unnamed protein product [Caenorhabditis angaria]|uniref:Poly [ADP-ribose] polymerase n=1 Tax=Caenorhabditis angaria TaxID=860376 RepID=A0A9P1N0I7_9PELO|nr:unnamed protein product [Caenorhabditis angaria]